MFIFTLEVLIVVQEGWPLETVSGCTGILNSIGHSRWAAGEDTNLREQDVVLLEAVEELVEVWTAKVSHRAQTSEETAARELLEVPLTDVLEEGTKLMFLLTPSLQSTTLYSPA